MQFAQLLCGNATKAQRSFRKHIREFREAFDLFDEDGGGQVLDLSGNECNRWIWTSL